MSIRSTTLAWTLVAAALAVAGCKASEPATETALETPAIVARAEAILEARAGSTLTGRVEFQQESSGRIVFQLVVEGVAPGPHAVHIHEHGDCSAPDASSAGGHWNPTTRKHGRWMQEDGEFHLGDIGNVDVGADGRGVIEFATDLWEMNTGGPKDVLGKSIIVHAKPDDYTTQPTGAAGDRIGCGPIRLMGK